MRKYVVVPGKWLCLVAIILWAHGASALGVEIPSALRGVWQLQDGNEVILIEEGRLVVWAQGNLRVVGLLGYKEGQLTVRRAGLVEHWHAVVSNGRLALEQSGKERVFRHLESIPDAVRLDPLPLGPAAPLPTERVSAIQRDLADRLQRDQNAAKDKTLKEEDAKAIVEDNTRHLRSLVQEIGWIDVPRFGSKTSYAAVILAKHGGDLRLLLGVLPLIERDFKHSGDDAQAFAIVYDSVQLDLGRKQRFGTQIRGAGGDKPFLLPLEDPEHVDALRREIGLPPLGDYLSDAAKALGKAISMPPKEEAENPPAKVPVGRAA
jgi:hypothetical protein